MMNVASQRSGSGKGTNLHRTLIKTIGVGDDPDSPNIIIKRLPGGQFIGDFYIPQKEREAMVDQVTFDFDWQLICLDDEICKRFLQYCREMGKFPKIIYVPLANANFFSPLLTTVVDRSLQQGSFRLAVR
jgi:hypothetical protein